MLNGSMRKVDDDDGSIRWRMTFCSFGSIVLRMGREHPGVSNGAAGVSRIRGGPTDPRESKQRVEFENTATLYSIE